MLLRRLSQAVPWPAAAAPLALPAPPFLAAVASHQLQSSATQRGMGEEALSSGHVPERTAPDASNTVHLPEEGEEAKAFDRAADLYLGGLWSKLEEGLHSTAGPGQAAARQVAVQLGDGAMRVELPDGARIEIAKDPATQSLLVRSTLHDTFGSDGSTDEVPFKLQADHTWEAGGEELHQFVEDGLAKHLKVQMDLEPDAQTTYGPDPT